MSKTDKVWICLCIKMIQGSLYKMSRTIVKKQIKYFRMIRHLNIMKSLLVGAFLACFFIVVLQHLPKNPVPPEVVFDTSLMHNCPLAEDILRCKCNSSSSQLQCSNMENDHMVKDVFLKLKHYQFKEVWFVNSILQYFPFNIFQDVLVRELHLINVTVVQLFDDPPLNLQWLGVLRIERTLFFNGIPWEYFKSSTNLRNINIQYSSVPVLDNEFSEYVTRQLQEISFYKTGTATLQSGVFSKHINLINVAFEACELTELRRDRFPNPFHVRILHFNYNRIASVPDDLFSNMPNLQVLGLKGNLISVLPEFDSLKHVKNLLLEGNPLLCDCRIQWLLIQKPENITGQCEEPNQLKGYKLIDLNLDSLKC